MRFLDVRTVRALHEDQIASYGGAPGLGDAGLLDSAVARPQQLVAFQPEVTVPRAAACLSWALLKNHAFVDGNKRVAFAALVTFLALNGYELTSTHEEELTAVMRAAASDLSEDDWTRWVTDFSRVR